MSGLVRSLGSSVVFRFVLVLSLIFSVGLLASAGASAQGADAQVRVVHASPDAPAVDVFVNGDLAVEGLEFGTATDFLSLPAGEYQVQVSPAGGTPDDAVIDAMLPLEGGQAYDVAAVGFLAEIGAEVYPVDLSPTAAGSATVRAVHASPDAPAVDVAVTGGPVLFSGLQFPNASDYAEVDAGAYDLEVRPAGTEDVAVSASGVALDEGVVYDVYAIGSLEDGSLSLLPLATNVGVSGDDADGVDDEGMVTEMPSTGVGSATASVGSELAIAALAAVSALTLAFGAVVYRAHVRIQ